jgi:hypothetical protein
VITYEQLKEELRRANSPTERRLHFAALLAKAGGASTDEFIVVGGSAIEFYTSGQYTSGDIDIVETASVSWKKILTEWRFKDQGRIWYSEDLGIVVDFVKPPYTYDVSRTQVLVTAHGSLRIAAIEDLLVKRLQSAKFWKRPAELEQAKLLAVLHWERIDWAYVRDLAARFDVADLLTSLMGAVSRTRPRP